MFSSGVSISATGALNIKASAAPIAQTAAGERKAGFSYSIERYLHTVDATASLPAGAFLFQGTAVMPDGRVCTTTGNRAAGAYYKHGILHRVDGAVHISTAAVAATSTSLRNGMFTVQTGGITDSAIHVVSN